ncbi:MAG: TlpA family protein disulfide reductase [Bryobacterales bacterium]|nr:TlpA family protein disulfide reductase [Bryobacterales bacterium]
MARDQKSGANPQTVDRLLVALIVLCALGVSYGIYDAVREKIIQPGDRAPGFRLTTNQGATVTPTSFGGELLLVNFWATWCPPCVEEMPSLEQFHRTWSPKGIVVLGVNVDQAEQTYQSFVQRSGITFANSFDPDAEVGARFGTFRYPETYLINRDGRVLEKFVGAELWTSPQTVDRITRHLPKG